MKNLFLFILISFFTIACTQKNTVVISGKITNQSEGKVAVGINYIDRVDTIEVNSDGTFLTKIYLDEEHLGELYYKNFRFPLYLEPGGNINIKLDVEDLNKSDFSNIIITGERSETTAFLNFLDNKWKQYDWQDILKMPLDSFIVFARSVEKNTIDELENFRVNNSPSDIFIERTKLRFDIMLVSGIKNYEMISYNNNTPVPLDFIKVFQDKIPVNDQEKVWEIKEYRHFLMPYYQDQINKVMVESRLDKETKAYINKLADEIIALDAPQEIKDEIGRWHFSVFYKRPDSLREVYIVRYPDVVKNQKYIDALNDHVDALERLKPGNIAPTFKYPDINDKMISSESLLGKVIYIDVWATWCGPCKYEFPYQKKLEAELEGEDVAFVSISVDEEKDKEAWEVMVKENKLTGYQLFAKGAMESKIVADYYIVGIPFFIIIDKEGKLVEVTASRPSDPETKEKLLKLAHS